VHAVVFVPNAETWRPAGAPGGLAPLERQLRQLRVLGCARVLLLVATVEAPPPLAAGVDVAVHAVPGHDHPFAALAAAVRVLPERFVFVAADHVLDSRVLRALRDAARETVVLDDAGRAAPVGRFSRAAVERHGRDLAAHAYRLALGTLDPYAPELRGVVPPYLVRVRTVAERRAAWGLLLRGVQKRGLDLPGEYFDSPFENALVRVLAPTRVTPNQITVVTLAVAAVVGGLFLSGMLAIGLPLALVVGILDGVDGKLARLKLATSRLGELEHVGDFLYENFWWIALAVHLHAATGMAAVARAGAVLVGCDLVDNLLYGEVRARTGRLLDELAPFDAGFRRVAGRRNVYVWICVVGAALGRAAGGYLVASWWALGTVVVHAVRAAYWIARSLGAPRDGGAPQVSEIDPVAGALVSEK
jgi:phosphatidylglycerophosphate synthase